MSETLILVGKTSILFLFTLLCFRLMGYRSLGDMEPLDYVIVLGIGEIMGSPLSGDVSVIKAAIAIATLTALQIILSALYARMPKMGSMMEGKPIPVIKNGRFLQKNLDKHRIPQKAIMEELRIKGLRDEKDVDLANLEPSGRFSVILKNEASPVTPRYMGEQGSYILAVRGKMRPSEWEESGVSMEEAMAFLAREGIKDWAEVDTFIYKNGFFTLEKQKP